MCPRKRTRKQCIMAIYHPPETLPDHQPKSSKDKEDTGRSRKLIKRTIAAVTLAGVLGGGGYTLTRGGEDASSGHSPDATHATPGASETQPTESPEAVVGQPGSTLDNISIHPTDELIQEALQPVTLAEYPTPEAALEQFAKIENVIRLSATVDAASGSTEFPETQESLELRDKLWKNFFSTKGYENYPHQQEDLPAIIAMELWYINESGALSTKETGTWHRDWAVNSVTEISDNTYTSEVTKTTITNFGELDEMASQNITDIAPIVTYDSRVDISNDGTTWSVDYMKQIS